MVKEISPEEYLNKDFDYTRLTKTQLRKIMYENGIEVIPSTAAKKSDILDSYRKNIHDRIVLLKKKGRITAENPFQKALQVKNQDLFESVSLPMKSDISPMKEKRSEGEREIDEDESIELNGSSLSSFFSEDYSGSQRSIREMSSTEIGRQAFKSDPTLDKVKNIPKRIKKKRSVLKVGYLIISIMISIGIYLRFICPYCEDDRFLCIQPPEHSKVVEGRLICSEGYILKCGVFKNYCSKDDRHQKDMLRKANEARKMLEKRNGDYIYGMVPSRMISITQLSNDEEMVEILKNEKGIVISGNMIYSVNKYVSIRTFTRYYFKRVMMTIIPLVLIMMITKIIQSFSRKRRERLFIAKKMVRDITDVLVRQIYVSTKNINFPSYVYTDQLKDCFGVDKNVWKEVEKVVLMNSNIREINVEEKKAWEWVGPILYKPEFNGSLL